MGNVELCTCCAPQPTACLSSLACCASAGRAPGRLVPVQEMAEAAAPARSRCAREQRSLREHEQRGCIRGSRWVAPPVVDQRRWPGRGSMAAAPLTPSNGVANSSAIALCGVERRPGVYLCLAVCAHSVPSSSRLSCVQPALMQAGTAREVTCAATRRNTTAGVTSIADEVAKHALEYCFSQRASSRAIAVCGGWRSQQRVRRRLERPRALRAAHARKSAESAAQQIV